MCKQKEKSVWKPRLLKKNVGRLELGRKTGGVLKRSQGGRKEEEKTDKWKSQEAARDERKEKSGEVWTKGEINSAGDKMQMGKNTERDYDEGSEWKEEKDRIERLADHMWSVNQ